MDNELGARIRTLRKERGLSQEALAQTLEVSRQAVTKWEDGSSLPSTANLFALAGFFSVPLAELTGTPESTSPAPPTAGVSEKERRMAHKGFDHRRVCAARCQRAGAPLVRGAVFYCRAAYSGRRFSHRLCRRRNLDLSHQSIPNSGVFRLAISFRCRSRCSVWIENQEVERKNT